MSPTSGRRPDLPDDPALHEALARVAQMGRLSDGQIRAMRQQRRRRLGAAGLAMVVCGVGLSTLLTVPGKVHYQTERGQQRDIVLADGSALHLNGDSSIDVRLGRSRRNVALTKGEVFFDIVHDPNRPFEVQVGDVSARVLGTAFDINMMHHHVELDVYRGAVRFAHALSPTSEGVVVKAGYRAFYHDGAVGTPDRFDPAEADRREGWLDTQGMCLGDLVEMLNRSKGPVILPPAGTLAATPLSGRFKLDDPVHLLRAIGDVYRFSVVENDRGLQLVPLHE